MPQVSSDFEQAAPSLSVFCVYGGTSYNEQNAKFRAGLDVLVGTTGRICDHMNRGTVRLDALKVTTLPSIALQGDSIALVRSLAFI